MLRRLSCTSDLSLYRDAFFSSNTSSISSGGQLLQSSKKAQHNNEFLLDLAKVEDSFEQKRISATSSMFKLKEVDVIPSRSHPQLDAPVAPYPPQQLKPPSKCPVGAIQHPLPLRLFDGELDSNQPLATLTHFKEPSSYAQSTPIAPGIALMSKDHSADSPGIALLSKEQYADEEDIINEQIKQFSPTPFTSMMQPLSVVEELVSPCKIIEASYESRLMNDRKKKNSTLRIP